MDAPNFPDREPSGRFLPVDPEKRYMRLNITLPRQLVAAFKRHLAGKPLSQAVCEMIEREMGK